MAAKLIKIVVTKKDSETFTTAVERWINPDYIEEVQIAGANGAFLRYTPRSKAVAVEYTTTTAASAINTAANA